MREKFAKHPIYHNVNYSVRSSRHESVTTFPPRVKVRNAPSSRPKHQSMKSGWQDPEAPMTPVKDLETPKNFHNSTFFLDDSPKMRPRVPEKACTTPRPTSWVSRKSSNKDGFSMAVESAASTDDCTSPLGTPPALNDGPDRWSWTNSQAPSTPRLLPGSRRTSVASTKYGGSRYRSVTSWARGQGERLAIDEENPPLLALPPLPSELASKNSTKEKRKPDLTIKIEPKPSKKLSKKENKGHRRAGSSLGALFRSTGNDNFVRRAPGEYEMDDRKGSR